jgi:hypothetical protein
MLNFILCDPLLPCKLPCVPILQALSPEQIYKIYQTYIKELSSRLVELNQDGCASEEITAQVEKLTKEVVSDGFINSLVVPGGARFPAARPGHCCQQQS